MPTLPDPVARFLAGKRLAVAGVSRSGNQPANAVFRRLRNSGYEVFPINPNASEVEGQACYPDVAAVPGKLDGVFAATHPRVALQVVDQCAQCGIKQLWFHRSFGQGSVSADAVAACRARGIECIAGGCPMMFCEPVDPAHRCMRWWLGLRRRLPR